MRESATKPKEDTSMKVQCYAIFDTCSGIYEKPFFSTTDDLVKREFQDIAVSADHPISNHPEHYSLWRLGNFDNNTGKILNEPNECLWQAVEAISQSQAVTGNNGTELKDYRPNMSAGTTTEHRP